MTRLSSLRWRDHDETRKCIDLDHVERFSPDGLEIISSCIDAFLSACHSRACKGYHTDNFSSTEL